MTNPRLLTVTLTTQDTNYQLSALLAALDTQFAEAGGVYTHARRLSIQADNGGGGANYYIGNSDMSGTVYGRALIATQYQDFGGPGMGVVILSQIYLRSDTAAAILHIIVEFQ